MAIARDADDQLVGYLIAVTPDNAPDFADDDPLLGPWLKHARATIPDGNVILWRDAVDFTTGPSDPARSEVQAMVNMAGVLRSGLANPRYAYLPVDPAYDEAGEFTTLLGAEHLAELDLAGEHAVQCHRVDYGPGGLLGLQRIVIYGELGLTPPAAAAGARHDEARRGRPGARSPSTPRRCATRCARCRGRSSWRATRWPPATRRRSAPRRCGRACRPRPSTPSATPTTSSSCARSCGAATSSRPAATSRPPTSSFCRGDLLPPPACGGGAPVRLPRGQPVGGRGGRVKSFLLHLRRRADFAVAVQQERLDPGLDPLQRVARDRAPIAF